VTSLKKTKNNPNQGTTRINN